MHMYLVLLIKLWVKVLQLQKSRRRRILCISRGTCTETGSTQTAAINSLTHFYTPPLVSKFTFSICHMLPAETKQGRLSVKWLSRLTWCFLCDGSVEGDAPGSEVAASVDPSSGYSCVPVTRSGGLGPDHLDSQIYGQIFLPGHPRPRRPKLQHSQSILRKQAEEEAIKRSRSLSESYELSSDLQDKQVSSQKLPAINT